MPGVAVSENGWHTGEVAMHKALRVPTSSYRNPTQLNFPLSHGLRIAENRLAAFGTLDDEGRPWTTVWGGESEFARPVAEGLLGVQSLADVRDDPVAQAIVGSAKDDELVRLDANGARGKMVSGVSIDLETRDRVKLAGRVLVAGVGKRRGGEGSPVAEMRMVVVVQESLGNCPKYINKKVVRKHIPSPQLVSTDLPLPTEATDLIAKSDLLFLSSTNGDTMDSNNRGGPPGFVRVASNTTDGVVLVYPEYSGNRLYQTLGNLYLNPRIGIVFPDFEMSDALFLTGQAEILIGPKAAALLSHTKLAIKVTVTAARFVKDCLPFRARMGEPSPYTPPLRFLVDEERDGLVASQSPVATASLLTRDTLGPSIHRYVFRLSPADSGKPPTMWKPGQHVTLDFSEELDAGYSHMRDDDPQSLNDDYVRTFTISNPPPIPANAGSDEIPIKNGTELEITVKRHGPVTAFLSRHNPRVPLKIPVLGFGGEESYRIRPSRHTSSDNRTGKGDYVVFVAGGIGITPVLAQAPGLLEPVDEGAEANFRLIWTLRAQDLPLALDVFERIQRLARLSTLFVTGRARQEERNTIANIERLGAQVFARRLKKEDVVKLGGLEGTKIRYHLCASQELLSVLGSWLNGKDYVTESFAY
ncbi:hypothetical protein VTK73DRAFT_8775 [Phialemonium thermophilum]|uniref:FAD-binding FR-type domain-containing protein n=1 Tax=Phialemonium thermophilum TaxID=223376 RepID=A0ABR3XMV8_9PEZI